MSTHTEHSAWSPDEADSLENIDKEIQLVSTSTESPSLSNQADENGSDEKIKSECCVKAEDVARQSNLGNFHSKSYDNLQAIKLHDLSLNENKSKYCKKNYSSTPVKSNKITNTQTNEQNKIKSNEVMKQKITPTTSTVITETSNKEDYLEQINKRLTKELDEKNAILSLLQENYEHLLFKYAEAQNRIDELRIKFLAEKTESKNYQTKYDFSKNCISHLNKVEDVKCQKTMVTPYINLEEPHSPPNGSAPPISRPSSLPLDNNLKFGERDLLKAATPTDSEGLSSIITSMSGHSKILNSLDEENQSKKSNFFKCKKNTFLLQENVVLNDPFDKVKNWQNSLPPLEQIETPETTLYNVYNAYSSNNTNYKDITITKPEKEYIVSDESCPLSWKEEVYNERCKIPEFIDEGERFHEGGFGLNEKTQSNTPCIIQRRQKRPPLLRCSSLPAYDYESMKSGNSRSGIYIPALDLNNVTLSDDESYCQQDYYINKTNPVTSSSFISSRGEPVDRSIQTPQSFSSCKATISEERVPRQTISKSTSITPDRAMNMPFTNIKGVVVKRPCLEECSDKTPNRCNVCGESIPVTSRSNSCESVHKKDVHVKEVSTRRPKPPFTRSISFNSGTNIPRYCSHDKKPFSPFGGLGQDTLENFDAYASNLKARSEAVIKALTAHVNNS